MGKRLLLDCTLRDGGYVNDWKFGHNNIVSIFERLVDANIDIIEIGFLDDRRPFDIDRSIMPDTQSADTILKGLDKKNAIVVGMIDYGTCKIENIKPCDESFLDGMRVIFKKHLRKEAFDFCRQIKELGYKVFAQLVSVTSYSDEEVADLISLANDVKPYAVSMVDTYGLMHQNNLLHYFRLLNDGLDTDIMLGYHGHNNFQMGYANCIAMLSQKTERTLMVDGSIYGMGKSAGNAPLELIAMHMNHLYNKKYDISQILEAIDSNIFQFYRPSTWGYNMFYYLAASNDCHPNYVSYLMNKRTLSVSSVNEILSKIESGDKKLLYDKGHIERLYMEYQNNKVDDSESKSRLKETLKNKKIMIIGPGVTVKTHAESIISYIEKESPVVISINYIPEFFKPDLLFLSNSKRYVQLASALSQNDFEIIATSNITQTGKKDFDYILNFSSLMDIDAEIIDNSLIMLLKALINAGVKNVALAGLDGYSPETDNYFNIDMEYDFVKSKADYLNNYTKAFLKDAKKKINIDFITPTKYTEQ